MSASKEKKVRNANRGDGTEKKVNPAAEQAQKDKAFRTKTIIAVVVIVLVVAAALVINSNLFYTNTTAVTIGDTRYSPAELGYFFKSTYNQVYEGLYGQLGDMISLILDPNKPLDEQAYGEDQTWADYIYESTLNEMKRITVYYDAAIQNGYTFTEADQATIDENLTQLRNYASSGNFPDLDKFLAAYYGKGMSEKLLVGLMQKITVATDYSNDLMASFTYSDADLDAYYSEHTDNLDYYNFYLYSVSVGADSFSELADDEAKAAAAHEAAEKIAAHSNYPDFLAAVKEFAGEATDVSLTHNTAANLSSSYKDWITDAARKAGDTTVVDADGASYVLLFAGKDDNNYNTVDMRHILVRAEAAEDGTYPEIALSAAKARAEEIYAEWKTDPTEENFAALAEKNSEDEGSNTNGGLYQKIAKNTMVPEINDFLFDAGTKVGDTKIVYGNNGQYAGYHVVYVSAENQNNRRILAENDKRSNDFTAAYEALSADYTAVSGGGLRFADLS